MNPYLAVEVGWLRHPKVRKVHRDARSLWVAGGLHAVEHETDGVIEKHMLGLIAAEADVKPSRAVDLVEAGLWEDQGDRYVIHDHLDYNPSRAQRTAQREKWRQSKSLHDDKTLIAAVRTRDGDRCRYCTRTVDWKDRRGERGGTYDHVDPTVGNVVDNVVVACRSCNSKKGKRTPGDAGLVLQEPTEDLQEPAGSDRELSARLALLSSTSKRSRSKDLIDVPSIVTEFERFWACYPRKVGKPTAKAAFAKALVKADDGSIADGLALWCRYWATQPDQQFVPHPTTWLNQERWNDRPPPPAKPHTNAGLDYALSKMTNGQRTAIETSAT